MKTYPQFSAIIFDMDGLMLDTERLAQRAWRRAGADWNYTSPPEVYMQAIGRTLKDTEMLFQEALGPDFSFQEIYQRKQKYLDEVIATEGIPTKAGLFELLDLVDRLGLPKAVATSTVRPQAIKKLSISGLLDHFETIICGNEILSGKPAPDIFLAAAQRLQVPPQQCLVLEDSEAGIKAAYAVGMTPVMVPDLKPPSNEAKALAYRIFPSLHPVRIFLHDMYGMYNNGA